MLVPQELDGDYFMESIHEKKHGFQWMIWGTPGTPILGNISLNQFY